MPLKTARATIPYVQPEMKFRSPPGQFHHKPPLGRTNTIGGSRIFLGGAQGRVHPDVYWVHSSEGPTGPGKFFWQTRLNRILTITQAYWDVFRGEAAFKTIKKVFSNLPNLKKVFCWMSEKLYY